MPPGPAGRVSGTGGETLLLLRGMGGRAGGRRPAAAASASRAGRALAASSAALLRPISCVLCNRTAPRVGRIVLVVVVDRIDMGCLGPAWGQLVAGRSVSVLACSASMRAAPVHAVCSP